MEVTKHDLSAGEVKLDYQALLSTARISVGKCIEEASKDLSVIREELLFGKLVPAYKTSLLRDVIGQLLICMETLHALHEGLSREDKRLVNL